MNIIFYNRDFTTQIPLARQRVTLERYSHTMSGGPDTAYIKIETSGDNWELTKLLRAPVEIYDGDGRLNWWGYVNRMTVPYGDIAVGLGLDNLYNYVAANYSLMDDGSTAPTEQAVTSWAGDAASIQEYGQKEKLLTINNATAAQAEAARDTYLSSNKYAPPEVELSGGNRDYVHVECYGWFRSLEWKYYSSSDTANTATTTQISNIVTGAGQFFRGVLLESASGIDSNQFRDGTGTAMRYITELMAAGTTNNRPLLARVDKDRYLHIYERQAETPEYLMRSDGQLETLLGQTVKPSHCITAAWVRIRDIPDTLGGLSAMRNFFIESAEYDAERDRTTYRPAGAFEPVRLAKWLGLDDTKLTTIGSSGGGTITTPYHTHPFNGVSAVISLKTNSYYNATLPSYSLMYYKIFNATSSGVFGTANITSGRLIIRESGYYHFDFAFRLNTVSSAGANSGISVYAWDYALGDHSYKHNWNYYDALGSKVHTFSGSGLFRMSTTTSDNWLELDLSAGAFADASGTYYSYLQVMKIGEL